MSELKPRDIWEVANQLEGYVGPDTEERLAAFLMREGREAAKLAERIIELEKELNTRAVPDVPELVRYDFVRGYVKTCNGFRKRRTIKECAQGKYVRYDQAAEIFAAKDNEIERLREVLRKAHASLEIDRTGRFEEFKNIINVSLGDSNA